MGVSKLDCEVLSPLHTNFNTVYCSLSNNTNGFICSVRVNYATCISAMVRALMALQRKINCLESEKQVVTPFSSDEPSAGGQMLDSTPRSPFSLLTEHGK